MMRIDWGLWSAIVTLVVIVVTSVVLCWYGISISLACGDRGGDIYWGAWLRHVCIAPDGRILP